jgi:hypothetical protein
MRVQQPLLRTRGEGDHNELVGMNPLHNRYAHGQSFASFASWVHCRQAPPLRQVSTGWRERNWNPARILAKANKRKG